MLAFGIATGLLLALPAQAAYDLIRDYSGDAFYNGWEFYGESILLEQLQHCQTAGDQVEGRVGSSRTTAPNFVSRELSYGTSCEAYH